LTSTVRFIILKNVLKRLSRWAALVMVLTLAGGHLTECQGWRATSEARMACCANEQECPMHKTDRRSSGSKQRISQADADRCCATAEHGDSMPAAGKAGISDAPALIPVGLSSVPDAAANWLAAPLERMARPPTGRSRHVLLSVFLI
jgi:hypothetical protein